MLAISLDAETEKRLAELREHFQIRARPTTHIQNPQQVLSTCFSRPFLSICRLKAGLKEPYNLL